MIRKISKKGSMDISFGWIFAIVVGGIILSLTIFGVTKFTNLQRTQQSAETSKSIDTLLNPLESSFESGQKVIISAPTDTRIYVQCDAQEGLGKQRIQTIQKTFNQWSDAGPSIVSRDKYLFLDNPTEGRDFIAFSKPFSFPSEESYESSFKVADLVYIFSQNNNYCFYNSPENIKDEISNLKINNFFTEECPIDSIKICFSKTNDCSIIVNYNQGVVDKDSDRIYFEGDSLMYAAIFSDKNNYECQLKRIVKRAEEISVLYQEKSRIEKVQGCEGNLESELIIFYELLNNFEESKDISIISNQAMKLNKLNSQERDCKLW